MIQFGYRGYRIGQVSNVVVVNHLLHHDSYIETLIYTKNMMKNRFAQQCRSTRTDKIQELAASMEDEHEV